MAISNVSGASSAAGITTGKTGFAALGQGDFLKLMTTQLQQQDPFAPVDNKEMLAQMAQFSQLAGIAEMGDTLKAISGKLDVVMAAQAAAPAATSPAASTAATSTTPTA
jgi:flagellar basal-body rod modification protein FlgD